MRALSWMDDYSWVPYISVRFSLQVPYGAEIGRSLIRLFRSSLVYRTVPGAFPSGVPGSGFSFGFGKNWSCMLRLPTTVALQSGSTSRIKMSRKGEGDFQKYRGVPKP